MRLFLCLMMTLNMTIKSAPLPKKQKLCLYDDMILYVFEYLEDTEKFSYSFLSRDLHHGLFKKLRLKYRYAIRRPMKDGCQVVDLPTFVKNHELKELTWLWAKKVVGDQHPNRVLFSLCAQSFHQALLMIESERKLEENTARLEHASKVFVLYTLLFQDFHQACSQAADDAAEFLADEKDWNWVSATQRVHDLDMNSDTRRMKHQLLAWLPVFDSDHEQIELTSLCDEIFIETRAVVRDCVQDGFWMFEHQISGAEHLGHHCYEMSQRFALLALLKNIETSGFLQKLYRACEPPRPSHEIFAVLGPEALWPSYADANIPRHALIDPLQNEWARIMETARLAPER